ncbi:MAG: transglycosylase SLT domain-containing protein, partial [Fibrobacter sp.]|nr:transglycosylase SLT domain-containing protein [Fibrobacter sp.]
MIGKSRSALFILFFGLSFLISAEETQFPVPDILISNVEFWKKIYSEVSLSEGLIHDRDYPEIIYAKVKGTSKTPAVIQKRKEITNALNSISNKQKSEFTQNETEIYNKFKTNPDALKGAVDRIRFQQGQMERFKEGLKISGMYLDTIRGILKKYGVPLQLAYLPHVESSFNTHAYSKVGAAGMWQFMRGTGRLYGLEIDYVIDERRDPVLATDAAARFLAANYRELQSWPLAITAYNHGVYGMKRAVKQTGSTDLAVIIQNYKSRSFQFASSNFYGCFLASCEIAENHKKYFPNLVLDKPIKYNDLKLSGYIEPDIICKYLNIPKSKLIALNPGIRPTAFEAHKMLPKGLILHIPSEISKQDAIVAINSIPDSLKRSEPPRPQYYNVRKGDNLYLIASRLGVSVNDLANENNISRLNRIYSGQVLRVPQHAKTQVASSAVKPKPAANVKPDIAKVVSTKAAEIPDSTTEAVMEIAKAEEALNHPPEEPAVIADVKT